MKQFRKRTLTLIFASVITMTACFADGNYKNSVMGLSFEPASNGALNLVIQTKTAYNGTITPVRKDVNTYVFTLPDTDSHASTPDLSNAGNISSVNVRTMPYSSTSNGYTRITVTMSSPVEIISKNTIYEPSNDAPKVTETQSNNEDIYKNSDKNKNKDQEQNYRNNERIINNQNSGTNRNRNNINSETRKRVNYKEIEARTEVILDATERKSIENSQNGMNTTSKTNTTEQFMLILGILLVIMVSIFLYLKAKNKLTDIAGERLEIDIDEESKETNKKNKDGSIKKAVKSLDKKYVNPIAMPVISNYEQPSPQMSVEKSTDDMNIVDLDELFNEQKKSQSDENDALDDFLSGFSFDEEVENIDEEAENKFDEDAYNKIINNKKMTFNKSDIDCINQILNVEIADSTLRNADKYAVSSPLSKVKRPTLEELVTTYAVSQNIIFTDKDVATLNKLMNVEIDKDFVTDLRINRNRTIAMEQEMLLHDEEMKKPSEVVTLKVSDMLPDLSDVMAHPDKYADPEPEKVVVDADALLKNIENVTFKPFDDGTRNFEILNTFDDESEGPIIELYSDDFLASKENNVEKQNVIEKEKSEKQIQAAEELQQSSAQKEINIKPQPRSIEKMSVKPVAKRLPNNLENNKQDRNIQPIKSQREQKPVLSKNEVKLQSVSNKQIPQAKTQDIKASGHVENNDVIKCVSEGSAYNVLSTIALTNNAGCHLAKNDSGYVVLGYSGDKVHIIKHYKDLKSEKIQARVSEKKSDGTILYIIRIGTKKFIASVQDEHVKYVMDL